jgi:integrase
LLLTGQRIGETQAATKDHIDGARWSIPKAISKSKRDHWVALSTQALAPISSSSNGLPAAPSADGRGVHMRDAQQHLERAAQHLFYSGTLTGVQAWLRRFCERESITPAFTPHDLRRTVTTRLKELGVLPHIVEKIVGHRLQGVMAVYNRAD